MGTHKFLAEEILVPNLDKTDGARINMFDSHVQQMLVMENMEYPRVFTNFENQVGKYSTSYLTSDRNWEILAKVHKHELLYSIILKDEFNNIEIIHIKPAEHKTQRYGYPMRSPLVDTKNVGDIIEKDDIIYRSDAYDDDLNFKYGVNLRAIYLSYMNLNYEDAIIISESAANKMSNYNVNNIEFTLNENNLLVNLYGDGDEYKGLPDIGQVLDDRILASRRRINRTNSLYTMTTEHLKEPDFGNDSVFYVDDQTQIVDIEILYNGTEEWLNRPINAQLKKYYDSNMKYYQTIVDVLEPYYDDSTYTLSDDATYYYSRYKKVIDPEIKYRHGGRIFNNMVVNIQTMSKNPLKIGSKLSGRYGNKGVISTILPDDKMPKNQYGEHAEIILSPLGVIGRLNVAQLYEMEINFISDNIVRLMKEEKEYQKKSEIYFDYLERINPNQYKTTKEIYGSYSKEEQEQYIDDIETKGIFIHQPPFFDNITFDRIRDIYKHYGIKKYDMYHEDQRIAVSDNHDLDGLVMGDLYFIRLKHDPSLNFSARSSGQLNVHQIPSKSNDYGDNMALYSETPIRLGGRHFAQLKAS